MAKKTKATKEPAFPLFEGLTERKMRSLGAKLDKIADSNGHKHFDALGKATDGPIGPLAWHLVRHGLACVTPLSAGLVRTLSENVGDAETVDELLAALRGLPENMGTLDKGRAREFDMLTPGVLLDVDGIIVEAYVRDREALLAAREALGDNLKLAIDAVRRRAGETIDPASAKAIFDHLVVAQCSGYGLASNCDVPRIVDGAQVEARLEDEAAVKGLALLFGDEAGWDAGILGWLRPHLRKFRSDADSLSRRARGALQVAPLSDVIYLFGDSWWAPESVLAILDRREDSPETLLAAAKTLLAEGSGPFKIQGVTFLPEDDDGDDDCDDDDDDDRDDDDDDDYDDDDCDDDDDDDDYDDDDNDDDYDDYDDDDSDGDDDDDDAESLDAGPDSDKIRCLAEILTVVAIERLRARNAPIPPEADASFDLGRVYDSTLPYALRLRGALAALGQERAHAVIKRVLAKQFYFGKAVAIADVCADAAMIEQVLARIDAGDYPIDAGLLGLSELGMVEAAAAHAAAQEDPKRAHNYREGILYIFARASESGVDWDPALDRHISVGDIYFAYGGSKVATVLSMLRRLPLDRYRAIMEANIPRSSASGEPSHLVRCLREDAPEALVESIFAAVVAAPKSVKHGSFGDDLRPFAQGLVAPIRRAIGDAKMPGTFMRELERALGPQAYEALNAAIGRPVETPLEELRRLAAADPGPKTTIYLLRRSKAAPSPGDVGRIGGAPIGVDAAAVPRFRDEPMEHVLTLDLEKTPGLARPGAGALALFLPEPDYGEHHESASLVWIPKEALVDAEVVSDESGGASAIEVEAIEVPAAIFDGYDLDDDRSRIRSLVYGSSGYARGGPLWLQDGEPGIDPSFLFQFDESLASINLGDCGVMYAFDGYVTWQCH